MILTQQKPVVNILYDLIILDVMLPNESGIPFAKKIEKLMYLF